MAAAAWGVRLGLAVGLILLGWAAYRLSQRMVLSRAKKSSSHLQGARTGLPAVVYFTTPDCAACKAVQRPALNRLMELMPGQLQLVEVDAYENPVMAKAWGVLSVPTTFILDTQGQPRHVNHGVTPLPKLVEQVRAASDAR